MKDVTTPGRFVRTYRFDEEVAGGAQLKKTRPMHLRLEWNEQLGTMVELCIERLTSGARDGLPYAGQHAEHWSNYLTSEMVEWLEKALSQLVRHQGHFADRPEVSDRDDAVNALKTTYAAYLKWQAGDGSPQTFLDWVSDELGDEKGNVKSSYCAP